MNIRDKKTIYKLFIIICFLVFISVYFGLKSNFFSKDFEIYLEKPIETHENFRDSVVGFAAESALRFVRGKDVNYPENLEIEGNWDIQASLYFEGEKIGEGKAEENILSYAIDSAVKEILSEAEESFLKKKKIKNSVFLIELSSNHKSFIFSGNFENSYDILDSDKIITAVYGIDKNILMDKIKESKNFLLSIEHPLENGFYKYYLPFKEEKFEERLHTTYSASIIYSLLFVYEFDKDEKILEKLSDWGDFLLKMQNVKEKDKRYGAFSYSYFFDEKGLEWGSRIIKPTINMEGGILTNIFYIDEKGRELRYVIGTNSKAIFTLLRLYEYTKDEKYLKSAQLSGDWLLTMQNEDGKMKPYSRYQDGKWYSGTSESFLYQGQVLSAFSRLYNVTREEKYYNAAKKIADRFANKIEEAGGGFIVDEYRKVNAISNSWVAMSLMDFYIASPDDYYKNIIFNHSSNLIEDQIINKKSLINFGRYKTAFSTSGNGWIAEVLTEIYRFCLKEEEIGCEKYKDSALKAIRWVLQYTYSKENTFNLKNSSEIIGGIYWSKDYRHIRTDSIAHSLNAYARIIEYLKDEKIIFLESPDFIIN